MSEKSQLCILHLADAAECLEEQAVGGGGSSKRLTDALAVLETIDRQRTNGQDSLLGRVLEEQIIQRELLELELQRIDELIEKLSAAARDG